MAHGYAPLIQSPIESFGDFLYTDAFGTFLGRWRESDPPSLLDLIGGWVSHGDATHACGSYETFLVVVLCLVDHAQENSTMDCGDYEMGDGSRVKHGISIATFARAASGHTPTERVTTHPALNRTLWELVAADNNRKKEYKLGILGPQGPPDY